jgi:hypothetical protein
MNNKLVIHVLESSDIHLETEILNIKSNGSVNISINKILYSHQKYKDILNEIKRLESSDQLNEQDIERISILNKTKIIYEINSIEILSSINDLRVLGHDVSLLTELFTNGDFKKINELLELSNLITEQSNLIAIKDAYKKLKPDG